MENPQVESSSPEAKQEFLSEFALQAIERGRALKYCSQIVRTLRDTIYEEGRLFEPCDFDRGS